MQHSSQTAPFPSKELLEINNRVNFLKNGQNIQKHSSQERKLTWLLDRKPCLVSLTVSKIQMKTTAKYHLKGLSQQECINILTFKNMHEMIKIKSEC